MKWNENPKKWYHGAIFISIHIRDEKSTGVVDLIAEETKYEVIQLSEGHITKEGEPFNIFFERNLSIKKCAGLVNRIVWSGSVLELELWPW